MQLLHQRRSTVHYRQTMEHVISSMTHAGSDAHTGVQSRSGLGSWFNCDAYRVLCFASSAVSRVPNFL